MPDGATHHRFWRRGLTVVAVSSAFLFVWGIMYNSYVSEFAVWWLFWYWMGRYIDPDLDLLGTTMAEGRMLRELDLLGVFMVPVWTFYAAGIGYAVKKFKIKGAIGGTHRTWLTHSLIPGTLIRQALICLCLHIAVNWATFGTNVLFGGTINFHPSDVGTFLLAQFAGLGLADAIHIYLDNHYGGE